MMTYHNENNDNIVNYKFKKIKKLRVVYSLYGGLKFASWGLLILAEYEL